MDKEELIGKLQMIYVGDRNALNEMIGYYDGLKEGIEELKQENEKNKHYKTLYQSLKKQNDELNEDISFCLKSIKQEMEMSTDSRTRGEMKSCYEILDRWNK